MMLVDVELILEQRPPPGVARDISGVHRTELGLFVPLIVFAAAGVAWPRVDRAADGPRLRLAGLAIVGLVGGLVATTLFDDLAGELARRSSF
jgi:hypothetical protein